MLLSRGWVMIFPNNKTTHSTKGSKKPQGKLLSGEH